MGITRFTCFASVVALCLLVAACADDVSSDDGTNPTSSNGGSGNEGGAGAAGGGGGEYTGPCAQDCSKIVPPKCFMSVCNQGEYPGPVDTCTIVPTPGAACEDDLFCTVNDTCDEEGACIGGPQNTCGRLPGQCSIVGCDEAAKSCTDTPAADGDPCVDDDLCTLNGKCQGAQCVGVPKNCDAPPEAACNTMACNPDNGDCEPTPDASKDGAACSFGELCNVGTTCDNGACTGGQPKNCSQLSQGCLAGVCNPQSGLCTTEPVADGGSCSDGDSCTAGETCSAGVCGGGAPVDFEEYFSEDFSDNGAGWTLETGWQIGPAMTSSGQDSGSPDPAQDVTATADNGVAGVVIGGNADLSSNYPFRYLTSPAIDTSAVPGPLYVVFWRHLNSDGGSWMDNSVEVWDGGQWSTVWTSGEDPNDPIEDSQWVKVAYELTPYKSATMKVRFGISVLDADGSYVMSSWNIDDVTLANQSCN